jgi:hypothetical protein
MGNSLGMRFLGRHAEDVSQIELAQIRDQKRALISAASRKLEQVYVHISIDVN